MEDAPWLSEGPAAGDEFDASDWLSSEDDTMSWPYRQAALMNSAVRAKEERINCILLGPA